MAERRRPLPTTGMSSVVCGQFRTLSHKTRTLAKLLKFLRNKRPPTAYSSDMKAVVSKTVALIAALVLALPPGLCCGMGWVSAKSSPPKKSCCHQAAPASESQPAPARPQTECCCSIKATVPNSSVQTPDASVAGMFDLPLAAAAVAADRALSVVPVVTPTGPPLHVLHCVWRI